MNGREALNRLERLVLTRPKPLTEVAELLLNGHYLALLAPVRFGRSTFLRALKAKLADELPDTLFLLVRPDHSLEMPREAFFTDLLAKLKEQLAERGITPSIRVDDPYLQLKKLLAALPGFTPGQAIVAVDDVGKVDIRHLKNLLWAFRELHEARADGGDSSPLMRLSVVVAGSSRLFELTIGEEDHTVSPFNIADLYYLPAFLTSEVQELLQRLAREGILSAAQANQMVPELQTLADGHPALLKAVLAEVVTLGGRITRETLAQATKATLSRDKTLSSVLERLRGEPEAMEFARQIFLEGKELRANLEMAPEDLRLLFWLGLVVDKGGSFRPRCALVEQAVKTALEQSSYLATPSDIRISGVGVGAVVAQGRPEVGNREPARAEPASPRSPRTTDPTSGGDAPTGEPRVGDGRPGPEPRPADAAFPDALFPEALVRGFREEQGVLFVGAGVSRSAGLPSWAELSAAMKERLRDETLEGDARTYLEGFLESASDLAIAQHLRDTLGAQPYHAFLKDTLRKPVPLSEIHRALQAGRAELHLNLVVTTNYDKLLEKTFRSPEGDDPPVILYTSQLPSVEGRTDQLLVVKMHGDIDHPESIVLTEDDYRGYFAKNLAMRRFLEHQFSYRTVLFLGFGLKDPNFDAIYSEVGRLLEHRQRPAFALMVGNNPIESAKWRARGLHILDLSEYGQIPGWIARFAERVASA